MIQRRSGAERTAASAAASYAHGEITGSSGRPVENFNAMPQAASLSDRPAPSDGIPPRLLYAILAITLIAAVPRFYGLGGRDFWFDESCTFIYVHHLFDWPEGSNLLAESTNLPYYVLLRGWSELFGDSEAAYRSFSAAASTLTIPILALAAFRLGGGWAAIVCAALAAFHPLHIYYAREARAYALWGLLLSGALLLAVEAAVRNTRGYWAAFGAALWASLHTHYFTLFWAPCSLLVVLLSNARRAALRRWFVTVALVGLAFLPYAYLAMLPAARGGGSAWIAPRFNSLPAIPRTLWAFLPAGAYPPHLPGLSLTSPDPGVDQPAALQVAARVLPAIGIVGVALLLLRRASADRNRQGAVERSGFAHIHLVLGVLTIGPLIGALIASVVFRPIYLVGRYDLVAWPAAVVWLAILVVQFATAGDGRIRVPRLAGMCLPLLLLSLVPIHRVVAFAPPPSFHHVRASRLAELAGPDDVVIALSYDRDHLQYYLHRSGFDGTIRSFPSWLENQVGWVDTRADLARIDAARDDAAQLAAEARAALLDGRRTFLLSDSMDLEGTGPRSAVHRAFFHALEAYGIELHSVDGGLGIFRLRVG